MDGLDGICLKYKMNHYALAMQIASAIKRNKSKNLIVVTTKVVYVTKIG